MTHSTLLIITSVLFCKAFSLTCYQCIPETSLKCTETKVECAVGQCGNMKTTTYVGSAIRVDMVMKNCSLNQQCVSVSVNFGVTRTIISNQCCNTNLCNSDRKQEVMTNIPNGKKCYTCNGDDCSSMLDCVNDEDLCIKSTVGADGQMVMMRGCATRSFCTGNLSAHLGHSSSVANLTCCEGNLCNDAKSIRQSLLMLGLLPLFITLH